MTVCVFGSKLLFKQILIMAKTNEFCLIMEIKGIKGLATKVIFVQGPVVGQTLPHKASFLSPL